jgi:hypothetical protein
MIRTPASTRSSTTFCAAPAGTAINVARGRLFAPQLQIKFRRASQVGPGPIQVPFIALGVATVFVGCGEFRIEFDGASAIGDGSIQVAFLALGVATVGCS